MEPTATALTVKPPRSHPVVLHNKQATFVLSNTTQVYLTNLTFPHNYAPTFSLYLGHLQACQHTHSCTGHYNRYLSSYFSHSHLVELKYHINTNFLLHFDTTKALKVKRGFFGCDVIMAICWYTWVILTVMHSIHVMIRYMIHLSTVIGLTPGGSNTVHIYTQTIHRTT
jgi:hypothetical protein